MRRARAAGLFAGEAKTDERDAAVIARTALGVPDSLSGVPGRGEALEAARALSSQRDHVVACATRDKNRLRAVLLESCPALEAAVDLSDRRWLELLAGFGGAWGIARSGAGGPRAAAAGEAAAASTAPPPALVEAENRQVRFLAARISEALDEAGALEAETAALLEGDETYACLLTVPGIGPRTAAQLAVSVDIGRFPDHDHLASYCGIAPRVRSSGTSVRSVRASRRGDARLKSLLIFSCNSLVRSSGRYGEYYRACRARGMGARAGAQGRREEAAQGDIRRDARPGALPGVAPTVDKTIGTPNDYPTTIRTASLCGLWFCELREFKILYICTLTHLRSILLPAKLSTIVPRGTKAPTYNGCR